MVGKHSVSKTMLAFKRSPTMMTIYEKEALFDQLDEAFLKSKGSFAKPQVKSKCMK